QEAKDMVLYGLELSERLELPVLLRLVTRVAHARAIVKLKEVVKPNLMGSFVKNPRRFVPLPAHARIQHRTLIEKMEKAEQLAEASPFNFVEGKGRFGIVTAGISYAYTKDALRIMNVDASILKLGFIHPLPEALVADFVRKLDGVAVIEELEPILESQVKNVCFDHRVDVKVWGKRQGYFPRFGEFSIRTVLLGLSKILDKPLPINFDKIDFTSKSNEELSPPRPPILCPGCPHTATLYAIKMATGGRGVYPTDIGCYTLGVNPPLQVGDALLCMGSSVGLSNGMSIVLKEPVVAVVGDSTFFHASIPGLINAVYNNRKFVYVVLDNLTTAMTGFQPHPGTGSKACGDEGRRVLIEDVAKGCGVKFVEVVDPYDIQKTISAIKRALQHDGPSVIVARRACVAFKRPDSQPFQILPELCKFKMHQRGEAVKACMVCVRSLGCPSLLTVDDRLMIDESTCTGCG
ncbi:MAG TPA: indolepyruvate ferredoxin oxidoreductase subunit alpha, partial [Chromatiaceae bacterium]|nr:indolepyruvate ferredoxin oxidoreductase subunit alpha [Chromatiaceae bacterium]